MYIVYSSGCILTSTTEHKLNDYRKRPRVYAIIVFSLRRGCFTYLSTAFAGKLNEFVLSA